VINEKSQAELRLLKNEQKKAQQDEVFCGLSKAERAQFNRRAERIQDLESEMQSGRGH
jgi:DNA-binding MarR family transcriptional regulator